MVLMSDNFLRLMPEEPEFEPSDETAEMARRTLATMIPIAASIEIHRFPEVCFIDAGSNFERVLCPHCGQEVTSSWPAWIDECYKSQFTRRMIVWPCCGQESDLNKLLYEWPSGFAKFVLKVMNPDPADWLAVDFQTRLEGILLNLA